MWLALPCHELWLAGFADDVAVASRTVFRDLRVLRQFLARATHVKALGLHGFGIPLEYTSFVFVTYAAQLVPPDASMYAAGHIALAKVFVAPMCALSPQIAADVGALGARIAAQNMQQVAGASLCCVTPASLLPCTASTLRSRRVCAWSRASGSGSPRAASLTSGWRVQTLQANSEVAGRRGQRLAHRRPPCNALA